jgi:hypothetical protein
MNELVQTQIQWNMDLTTKIFNTVKHWGTVPRCFTVLKGVKSEMNFFGQNGIIEFINDGEM